MNTTETTFELTVAAYDLDNPPSRRKLRQALQNADDGATHIRMRLYSLEAEILEIVHTEERARQIMQAKANLRTLKQKLGPPTHARRNGFGTLDAAAAACKANYGADFDRWADAVAQVLHETGTQNTPETRAYALSWLKHCAAIS